MGELEDRTEVSPEGQTNSEHEKPSLRDIVDVNLRFKLLLESLYDDPSPPSKHVRFISASDSRYISRISSNRWKTGITYSIFGDIESEKVLEKEPFEEENPQEMECQSSTQQSSLKTPGTPIAEEHSNTEDTDGRKSPEKPSEKEEPMAQEPPEKHETAEKEEPMEQEPPEKYETAEKEPMVQKSPEKETAGKEETVVQEQDLCSEESIEIFEYDLQSREQRKETEAKNKWCFCVRTTIFPDLTAKYFMEKKERQQKGSNKEKTLKLDTLPTRSTKEPSSGSVSESPKDKCSKPGTSAESKLKTDPTTPEDVKRSPKRSSLGRDGAKTESPTAGVMTRSKRKAGSTSPAEASIRDEKKKRSEES